MSAPPLPERLPDGRLLVPMRGEGPGGVIGDGLVAHRPRPSRLPGVERLPGRLGLQPVRVAGYLGTMDNRLDNPAGRLHVILSEFSEVASNAITVGDAWRTVLGVEGEDVYSALGGVAGLLPKIEQALRASDNEDAVDSFRHYQEPLARPIMFPDRKIDAASHGLVSHDALHSLRFLAKLLSRSASEGNVPDQEALDQLRDQVKLALDTVWDADDLEPRIRQIILQRLEEVLYAIQHFKITGPDGIMSGLERLIPYVGEVEGEESKAKTSVRESFTMAWTMFKAVPTVYQTIEAGGKIVRLITGG